MYQQNIFRDSHSSPIIDPALWFLLFHGNACIPVSSFCMMVPKFRQVIFSSVIHANSLGLLSLFVSHHN